MAKFLEYQGKEWLRKAGLPVPQGRVASTPEEAKQIAEEIGKGVAVKGQVQAGGRGKAGIVKLVNTPDEAAASAAEILSKIVMGTPVLQVLVEEKLDIKKEYYCSFVVNGAREARSPMLMFSTEGGMDIESVPEELLFKVNIDPINGLQIYDALDVCARAGIPAQDLNKFARFLTKPCELIEVLSWDSRSSTHIKRVINL